MNQVAFDTGAYTAGAFVPPFLTASPNSTASDETVDTSDRIARSVPLLTEVQPSSTSDSRVYTSESAEGSTLATSIKALSAIVAFVSVAYASLSSVPQQVEGTANARVTDSAPPRDRSLDDIRSAIDGFVGDGYRSSYGSPPNTWATTQAKEIVGTLPPLLRPIRIAPMADGGIALVFPPTASRAARVDITNDGEIVVTLTDLQGSGPEYREVASSEVATHVVNFLNT